MKYGAQLQAQEPQEPQTLRTCGAGSENQSPKDQLQLEEQTLAEPDWLLESSPLEAARRHLRGKVRLSDFVTLRDEGRRF